MFLAGIRMGEKWNDCLELNFSGYHSSFYLNPVQNLQIFLQGQVYSEELILILI